MKKKTNHLPYSVTAITLAAFIVSTIFSIRSVSALADQVSALRRASDATHRTFRLDEKQWQRMYQQYNTDYFAEKLPTAIVKSRDDIGTTIFGQTYFESGKPHIEMNSLELNGDKEARGTLLHEMIHVKLHQVTKQEAGSGNGGWIIVGSSGSDDHGEEFMKELHRLITLGAFDDVLG